MLYGCFNCNASMSFESFLKWFDPNLYSTYKLDAFKERMGNEISEDSASIPETSKYVPDIFSSLPLITELATSHLAFVFCERRKLPIGSFPFYYAEKFIEWANGNTDKFKMWKGKDHHRIVIPWYDRNKKIIGYSARALDATQEQKYYRIFVDSACKERFFGLDRVNAGEQVYVLEGEIDSLMIPNGVAVANGKLQQYMNHSAIYIPDMDVRNKHIMKNVKDMIELGLKVCMLPSTLPGKDLNELVQAGFTRKELTDIINKNTLQGLAAMMKFNTWRVIA